MDNKLQKMAGTEVSFIMPDTDSLGSLKNMEQGFSLNLKYKLADDWAALKDKEIRGYYKGLKEIPNKDGELVTCAGFITEDECFISGQMILVEAVKNLAIDTPVSIIYRGKRNNKSSEGSTMLFDISILR